MASSNETVSMALFCDFENVALGVRDAKYDKFDIKLVLERLLLKGSIVVKKAYCDWDRYKSFKGAMHEANFELIEIPHVRQSGKNSADIRLVVDALDLCYTKSHVNTFVIISGDSDFSPLVSKLRENAKQVIGVGVQQSTSDLLIANCDEFFFYDDLVRESQRTVTKREPSRPQPAAQQAAKRAPDEEKKSHKEDIEKRRTKAVEIAVQTFDALASERGDGGKIWASVLKNAIKRRKPDFNETYYGFRAFGNLLEEAQARGLLEFGRDEKSGAYVYRSTGATVTGDTSGEAMESVESVEMSGSGDEPQVADAAVAASVESGGKHESRRRGRGNRKSSGRNQSEPVHQEQTVAANGASEWTQPEYGREHSPSGNADEFEQAQPVWDETESLREAAAEEPVIVAHEEALETNDTPSRHRKERAPRKPAAKKAKKTAQPTPDESTNVPVVAEARPVAYADDDAPAPAKKTARKTASRSRRPRKASTANDAE
ncbi:NYN domain-containing protein [Paraburkholderia sp. BCC1886]|uniref:NYN domain-containing protein n=1 Tax=Paraburkholderia sp. BCC1886 TaxID=2562670 RepID=UPI001181D2C9|nr:NYN domain-containing protein [Paraburkholderia sp. BCC1886]